MCSLTIDVFSYYRMCSLTIHCGMCSLTTECPPVRGARKFEYKECEEMCFDPRCCVCPSLRRSIQRNRVYGQSICVHTCAESCCDHPSPTPVQSVGRALWARGGVLHCATRGSRSRHCATRGSGSRSRHCATRGCVVDAGHRGMSELILLNKLRCASRASQGPHCTCNSVQGAGRHARLTLRSGFWSSTHWCFLIGGATGGVAARSNPVRWRRP